MVNHKNIIFVGLLLLALLPAELSAYNSDGQIRPSSQANTLFRSDHVATIRIVMKEDDWLQLQTNALAKQYVRADFWFDGQRYENVAVRPKGYSSLMSSMGSGRLPLKVDFNFFNVAQTFQGIKKICLNNGYKDPSFMREILGYELFTQLGITAPRAAFVDLWLNDIHIGLYTMAEAVDKTFLRRHFTNPNGNLYKPDMGAGALNWTKDDLSEQGTNSSQMSKSQAKINLDINVGGSKLGELASVLQREGFAGSDKLIRDNTALLSGEQVGFAGGDLLEQMELKTNENSPDHSTLLRFLDVLNKTPDESFVSEIEQVLDVDEVLRFLAVSALIVHLDNYIGSGQNYYLYENDGKFILIPWDLNEAFGGFGTELTGDAAAFNIDSPVIGSMISKPLIGRLLAHQPYLDKYHEYLVQLLEGPFAEGVIEARVDKLADLIRPFVEYDELKFFSVEEFERSVGRNTAFNGPGGFVGGMGTPGLMSFIEQRRVSVRGQLD